MIVDYLRCLSRYRGIHPNLDTAIRFIQNTDLGKLPDGRTVVDGENVFINVVSGETSADLSRDYEYHKHYIDLHIDVSGTEAIAITLDAPEDLGEFDEQSDGGLCIVAEKGQTFPLGPERFALAFPWEPHLPMIASGQPEAIHKCIVKIWYS